MKTEGSLTPFVPYS